jgi:hypothetical protein
VNLGQRFGQPGGVIKEDDREQIRQIAHRKGIELQQMRTTIAGRLVCVKDDA